MLYGLVIFDMDGTLTHDALDFESLHRELGLTRRTPVIEWIDTLLPQDRGPARSVLERYEHQAAATSTLRSGALETLARLRACGIRTALLTRNSGKSAHQIIARHQLVFDMVVSRDQPPAKPHPESIWMITRHFGVTPARTLMVGDYVFDLQVASAAGVESVLLVESEKSLPDFAHQATFHVSRLEHIVELVESPEKFRRPAILSARGAGSIQCHL